MAASNRREFLRGIAAAAVASVAPGRAMAQQGGTATVPYGATTLPAGIGSRLVAGVNGITMHVLEAGFERPRRPGVLLLHGFPELAYSWRKVMLPLAEAGYHVMAPDLRGCGRSGGTDVTYDDDLAPFSTLSRIRDLLALVSALGHRTVAGVVGHDFGSPTAGWCALARPDVFRSVVMMSAPFGGAASLPFDTADQPPAKPAPPRSLDDDLAALAPPRKHYQAYYSTREANTDMWRAPEGVHAFLRAYYHMKSADWTANRPFPLSANTAGEFAKLPRYYVMDLDRNMAQTVRPEMPTASAIAACRWLPDEELRVYSAEYERTGFQGGLQSYRVGRTPRLGAETQLFAGRTIDVPSMFVGGRSDWGVYQRAGSLDAMKKTCTAFEGVHLVEGAGHWVQQERPEDVTRLLLTFLRKRS
jgi:pimeloyl-ACP methyl ester carboxylesterase